jgi:hypothetical protein
MEDKELPAWAVRLREERIRRLWSQKITAVRLRNAADEHTRAALPSVESIQRYVRDYEAGKHFPGDLYAELYCRAFGLTYEYLFAAASETATHVGYIESVPTRHDALSLNSWISATNISDDAIRGIAEETSFLSEVHASRAPALLLPDVVTLHHRIQVALREGKQLLRQTRELYKLDADLLAHASLLLGDLHLDDAALAYGVTAELCAEESDANPAVALSVQAKTQRWRLRFAESADLARQGYECSPATPIRVLLASQEANAAALLGDVRRAREALHRAEAAAGGPISPDSGVSAWSCPRPRQALFAMAVGIRTGDPDAALRAVKMADLAWASGDPKVEGTWAQVRFGAGIAHIMKGDLDATLREVIPAFGLAPEFRMATVTAYTSHMDARLRQRRFAHDATARAIRQRIHEFNAGAVVARTTGEGLSELPAEPDG